MRRRWKRWVAGTFAAALTGTALWIVWPLDPLEHDETAQSSLVLTDRHGLSLRATRSAEGARKSWVPLAEIDPDLLVAFVQAEDRRFYRHGGVDPMALGRALVSDLRAGAVVSGGSTITMQLARILHPSERTLWGKLVQAAWALRLDWHLSKQAILEQYLNRVPLGQGTLGVDAAADLYFGASARNLSAGQAALLAGLASSPSRDNPLAAPARAARRRARVLERLRQVGTLSPDEVTRARAEPVLGSGVEAPFNAPHFTSWVLAHRDALADRRSTTLRTSLDLGLQAALEAEVRHTVAVMRKQGAEHAALVVLDNRSGDILTWVGSPDFFDPGSGQVDMVVSPRQPGSTLKAFLYGLAFDRGYTPATVLPDLATVYQTTTGPYAPRNYDRRFHGPIRIREALASSFNVPAVELANRIGVSSYLETLHRAGFASLRQPSTYYGLGLALGNGEVTLLELANGYRALANGGVWHPARWWASSPGEAPLESRTVMSGESAALVLDILSDPVARIPGFGPSTPLEFPFPAAAKTGTSRHFTDNWAVAVTGGFTVAVWVGNFSGRPMDGVSGVSGAGPLLHRAALLVADRYPPGDLPGVRGRFTEVVICRSSGLVAGPHCPRATEWFRAGTAPTRPCDWHTADGMVLPPEYQEWAAQMRNGNAVASASMVRAASDTGRMGFRITTPREGDRYRFVPGVERAYATLGLRVAGAPPRAEVRWSVDGRPVPGPRWPLEPGAHRIRAQAGSLNDEVTIEVINDGRTDP